MLWFKDRNEKKYGNILLLDEGWITAKLTHTNTCWQRKLKALTTNLLFSLYSVTLHIERMFWDFASFSSKICTCILIQTETSQDFSLRYIWHILFELVLLSWLLSHKELKLKATLIMEQGWLFRAFALQINASTHQFVRNRCRVITSADNGSPSPSCCASCGCQWSLSFIGSLYRKIRSCLTDTVYWNNTRLASLPILTILMWRICRCFVV